LNEPAESASGNPSQSTRRPAAWVVVTAFAILLGFMALIAWGLRNAMSGPIRVGDSVPDISLTTFDGRMIHTSQYKGKVIVVNFWASWCLPCEAEAAELEEAWQRSKGDDEVVFLGFAWTDTERNSLAYLEKFNVTYPNGPDLRTQVSQMFRIRGVPETYIIGRDGKLKYAQIGPFESVEHILQAVEQAKEGK